MRYTLTSTESNSGYCENWNSLANPPMTAHKLPEAAQKLPRSNRYLEFARRFREVPVCCAWPPNWAPCHADDY
ncbi:MAG: hypothetical protein NTNFB02_11820 [Nitrospira sp.]